MQISPKNTINAINLLKETQAHSKSVNDILFIEEKNFLITASSDGYCKIFEMSTLKMLKKISFRLNQEEKNNYSIRGIKYDKNSNSLFTIQAPMRGDTYLTKWSVSNNFQPIETIFITDTIACTLDFSPKFNLISVADCKGGLIYVDPNGDMSIIKKIKFENESTIKSIAFKNHNVISGTADNALQLNTIYTPNFISLTLIFKILIVAFIAYCIYIRNIKN